MKKLFTEYWQEFDLRYIKNMYGVELPLLYFVIYWSWSLVFGNAAGTDATSVTEKIILAAAVIFRRSLALFPIPCIRQHCQSRCICVRWAVRSGKSWLWTNIFSGWGFI